MNDLHTPGPWTVRPDGLTVTGPIGDRIADCNASTGKPEAEKKANAKLIAASPALLHALRKIDSNAAESPEWIRLVIKEAINLAI